MDKTTVFEATFHPNKRKPTDSTKYTDNFLSDEIHANLRAMSFLVPFGAELDALFAHGMFMKSNAKAFPHVTRYLLLIYDAIEFRKKFRWPIFDKAGEALFRNSAMEAMNRLNVKYALGLDEIKNKILVFPGGLEFMRLIFEVSRLCMQILLKRNASLLNDTQLTLGFVRDRTVNMEKLHDTIVKVSEELQTRNDDILAKTRLLTAALNKSVAHTSITSDNILFDDFLDSWADVQLDIVENVIEPHVNQAHAFETICERLMSQVDACFDYEKLAYNASDLSAFGVNMQSLQPQYYQQMSQIVTNGKFRMDCLLLAFRLALPSMLRSIATHRARSLDVLTYESKYMRDLSQLAGNVFQQAFQLTIKSELEYNDRYTSSNSMVNSSLGIDLKALILSTPPVTYDPTKRQTKAAVQMKRISLMDTAPVHMRSIPMLRSITEQSSSAADDANTTLVGNSTFRAPTPISRPTSEAANKRLDPMRMLRNVHRMGHIGSPKRQKRLEQPYGDSIVSVCSQSNDTAMSVPDFSSTLIGTEVHDKSFDLSELNMSIARALSTPTRSTNVECSSPGGGVVGRIRHAQLDSMRRSGMQDISLSPSGRIEPLAAISIQANSDELTDNLDVTLTEENSMEFGKLNATEAMDSPSTRTIQKDTRDARSKETIKIGDIENDLNVSNRPRMQNLANLIDENDECLMNISDGILTNFDSSL